MTFLARIVAWTTAGYPEGGPGPDRVPLFAPLKRRDTDELPTPDDIERVQARLAAKGSPLDDPRDGEEQA